MTHIPHDLPPRSSPYRCSDPEGCVVVSSFNWRLFSKFRTGVDLASMIWRQEICYSVRYAITP
jgi:hypothetical protein